jgi:hypothetical protein
VTAVEKDIKDLNKRIFELIGVKESDTGLAPPSQWDLVSDKQMMQEEQPLQVGSRRLLCILKTSFWSRCFEQSPTDYVAGGSLHQDHQSQYR